MTITFDSNGGSSVTSKIVTCGSPYGTLDSPSKANLAFGGWYLDSGFTGSQIQENDTVTVSSDTTVYAKWLHLYTISYDANDATSGTVPEVQTKIEGQTLTLRNNTGTLQKDNVVFCGWNTAQDGTGTNFGVCCPYALDGHKTLYALWKPAKAYTKAIYEAQGSPAALVITDDYTSIDSSAFKLNKTLKTITIPYSISRAFCKTRNEAWALHVYA